MATCTECVHPDICKFKDLPAPLSDSYIRESECIEKRCGDFKDRSRFVELPCKVGDTIYSIENGYIKNDSVTNIVYYANINEFVIQAHFTCFNEKAFGKTVFLTREEAEAALRERESNV